MRFLSPISNSGFLISPSGLLYRMDKKAEFLIFFGIKPIEQFFSGIQGCNELRRFLNVPVSLSFHITLKYVFHGSYCTFSKCSLSLTQCRINVFSFRFLHSFLNSPANSVPLSTQIFRGHFLFVIMVKIARTVTPESFVFIPFASTVPSSRLWRTTNTLNRYYLWLVHQRMPSHNTNFYYWFKQMLSFSWI